MAELIIPDEELKMMREALCAAQHTLNQSVYNRSRHAAWSSDLQKLIFEIDRHRPLGVNGKHGKLHTETCGCEDKGVNEHVFTGVYDGLIHACNWEPKTTWCGQPCFYPYFAAKFESITCNECKTLILREI